MKSFILLATYFIVVVNTERHVLPTIFWHPKHPIFACPEPTLNVRYNDYINFFCPNYDIHPQASTKQEDISESMYVVKDEEHFKTCNATWGTRFLRCNHDVTSGKCKDGGIDCPHFYNMVFQTTRLGPNEISFVKGGDYYLIAPSYRTTARLDGVIGGSCNTVRNPTEYKMRLKIHMCTDEEIAKGECERCLTEACYYKDCKPTFKDWIKKSEFIYQNEENKCFVQEERKRIDQLIGSVSIESRNAEITCPVDKCSQWLSNELQRFYSDDKCFRQQTRTCVNQINGVSKDEKQYDARTCPGKICSAWKSEKEKTYEFNNECFVPQTRTCLFPWINISATEYNELKESCRNQTSGPITDELKQDESDDKTLYIIIAVFSSVICFILGVIIGSYIIKYRYNKKNINKNSQITMPHIIDGGSYITKDGEEHPDQSPFYFVDGVVFGGEQAKQDNQIPAKPFVTRSISFNHVDNRSYTPPPPTSTLPRQPNRQKVARMPSTTSQILLLRHVSDANSFQGRLNSENLDRMVAVNKKRLGSTCEEENIHDV